MAVTAVNLATNRIFIGDLLVRVVTDVTPSPTLRKEHEGWGNRHPRWDPGFRPFAAAQGFACGLPLRSRPHNGSNADPSPANYAGSGLRLRAQTPAKRLRLSRTLVLAAGAAAVFPNIIYYKSIVIQLLISVQ
jgi:hypothetical protein